MESNHNLSARSIQYYVIARRWNSDIEFFKLESAFLRQLIDDHFKQLAKPFNIGKLRVANDKLLKLEHDTGAIERSLGQQITQLSLMAEDVIPEDTGALEGKQVKLEYLINNLNIDYREVKKEIFTLVANVISENKLMAQ
jgi:hypothetical protein